MKREDLQKLKIRLGLVEEKVEGKARGIPDEEKQEVREGLMKISVDLAKFLDDEAIASEMEKHLQNNTRKQLVLYKKEIAKLNKLIDKMLETF